MEEKHGEKRRSKDLGEQEYIIPSTSMWAELVNIMEQNSVDQVTLYEKSDSRVTLIISLLYYVRFHPKDYSANTLLALKTFKHSFCERRGDVARTLGCLQFLKASLD